MLQKKGKEKSWTRIVGVKEKERERKKHHKGVDCYRIEKEKEREREMFKRCLCVSDYK